MQRRDRDMSKQPSANKKHRLWCVPQHLVKVIDPLATFFQLRLKCFSFVHKLYF